MKTRLLQMSLTGSLSLFLLTAQAQTEQPPADSPPVAAETTATNAPAPDRAPPTVEGPVTPDEHEPAPPAAVPAAATPGEATIVPQVSPAATPSAPATSANFQPPAESVNGSQELRLNFRGVPLEMMLNYLSDAAGFIIEANTPVNGKIDVWSSHPVSKEEALDILTSALNRNGYAAIRNGRILTILSKEEAIHADIPVKTGNDPAGIPRNDEIVTQIIPIRYVEAQQLVKDLSPLVSPHATIIANEAGNSIAVTDTQQNIRHLAEIIKAIDSTAEDVAEIRVFHLKHHDPVEIATLLTGLFSDQGSTTNTQSPFRFGGFGGFGGGRGAAAAAGAAGAGNAQTDRMKKRARVVAVADQRTSSVVVTASKDLMDQIAGMVEQLDEESPKVARVSVIHLENADPQQVQQVLQNIFQSSSNTRNSSTQASPLMNRIQQQQSSGTLNSGTTLGGNGLGSSRSGTGVPSF